MKVAAMVSAVGAIVVVTSVLLPTQRRPDQPMDVSSSKLVYVKAEKAEPAAEDPAVAEAKAKTLGLVAPNDPAQACTTDGHWCVSLLEATDGDGIRTPVVERAGGVRSIETPSEVSAYGETYAVWPKLIVIPENGFIAGVETRMSTSYSGGGGSATALRLFRVSKESGSPTAPILILPVQASLLIRACFSEADHEKRGEACHDEYGFTGQVEIENTDAGMPLINYSTQAWAFPRGASRDEDSTNQGKLALADLVRARDERCSFRRRFKFNAASETYEPDRALPDCSAYTVP